MKLSYHRINCTEYNSIIYFQDPNGPFGRGRADSFYTDNFFRTLVHILYVHEFEPVPNFVDKPIYQFVIFKYFLDTDWLHTEFELMNGYIEHFQI
jgi:hypothetical protein